MDKCHILKSKRINIARQNVSSKINPLIISFENIFSKEISDYKNKIVGVELIPNVDASKFKNKKAASNVFDNLLFFGEIAKYSLSYLSLSCWGNERFFVKIERSNLCDIKILHEICTISLQLDLAGVELIISIPERHFCFNCIRVMEGLIYLKKNNVSLSFDNINHASGNFNNSNGELYLLADYIKIKCPNDIKEEKCLDSFIKMYSSKKIILTNITNKEQLRFSSEKNLWGLQGSFFTND